MLKNIFQLFILTSFLISTHAAGQNWPHQNYKEFEGLTLVAAQRYRDLVVSNYTTLDLDPSVAKHNVKVVGDDDARCLTPENFGYFDGVNTIYLCANSFANFSFYLDQVPLLSIIDRKILSAEDASLYLIELVQFFETQQSGRLAGIGPCPIQYWIFLKNVRQNSAKCFDGSKIDSPAYEKFLSQANFYDLSILREDDTDAEIKKQLIGKPVDEVIKYLKQESFNDGFYGALSAVYFHELGHFYLKHNSNYGCNLYKEERDADLFSDKIIGIIDNSELKFYTGQEKMVQMYVVSYVSVILSKVDEKILDKIQGPTDSRYTSRIDLLLSARFAKFAALVLSNQAFSDYLFKQLGGDYDKEEFRSFWAKFSKAKTC
jgi:hypothetical protein